MQSLKKYNDDELYKIIKSNILREELGYYVNSNQLNHLYKIATARNPRIFEFAFKDAINIAFQIRNNMGNVKVIELKRIDFMTEDQLKTLLFTIGAAKNHENVAESESAVSSFAEIFGMELENLLFCKVSGDSMEDANIFEGDTLIIDTKSHPKNGDIIVITINNQTFVKRLKLTSDEMILVPENDNFEPHTISETDNYSIIGIVKHIVHSI